MVDNNRKELREFYQEQSHEQLVIFLMNHDLIENDLRQKLFLLTGCGCFGSSDGMNGSCVYCSIENEEQWRRCCAFEKMINTYNKDKKRSKTN